jgi:hypothetical protein
VRLTEQIERENMKRITKIGEKKRVIIQERSSKEGEWYYVAAQQYYPDDPHYWEVGEDGWRTTSWSYETDWENAVAQFEREVDFERRMNT